MKLTYNKIIDKLVAFILSKPLDDFILEKSNDKSNTYTNTHKKKIIQNEISIKI